MKSSKQITKRSVSPVTPKVPDNSEKKKKSASNYPNALVQVYGKQFETNGKTEKKRQSSYLKELLQGSGKDGTNKYRIVTEPVEDRIMHLVSSSFGRISKSKSRPHQDQLDFPPLSFKVRNTNRLNEKGIRETPCRNCQKHQEEIQAFKLQLHNLFANKHLWKNGQISLHQFSQLAPGVPRGKQLKTLEELLTEAKRHFQDLMQDIESLSRIDYPKMLKMDIFKFDPTVAEPTGHEHSELKALLSQLRGSIEGTVSPWDLEEFNEQSEHVRTIMRNLKARIGHCLRQNLDLRTKKAVLENNEEISESSEVYLRDLLEDVLKSYLVKI